MQLEVTKKTDFAVEALLALGRIPDDRVQGKTLADSIGVSPQYLPHVMRPLKDASWVESSSGPSGGYRLMVPLESISLLAIIEAVEGPMDQSRCVQMPSTHSSGQPCQLFAPWARASSMFLESLDATTLADLAAH